MKAQAVAILCEAEPGSMVAIWSVKYRSFCLPGGAVETMEALEEAAARELWEETGLTVVRRPIVLGVAKAVKRRCAAVWCEAEGVLTGSEEGPAYVIDTGRLMRGPYGPWTAWAIGAAKKAGLLLPRYDG